MPIVDEEKITSNQSWSQHWASPTTIRRLKYINTAYPEVVKLLLDLTNKKSNCIELGCGSGTYAIELLANRRNCIASDFSEEALELTKKKGKQIRGIKVPTQLIDIYNIAHPDNTFDLVFSDGVIEHLNIPNAAKEIKRVLGPNGWMVMKVSSGSLLFRIAYYALSLVEYRPFEAWLSKKQWHDIFVNAGYKNVSVSLCGSILAAIAMRIKILNKTIQYLPRFGRIYFIIKAQK